MIFAGLGLAVLAILAWIPSTSNSTQKDEIALITPAPVLPIDQPVDLLAAIDFKKHWKSGEGWRLNDGRLIIPVDSPSKLHLPVVLPDEFEFEVRAMRIEAQGPFALGVNAPGKHFHILIDAWRKNGQIHMTALGSVGGRLTQIVENTFTLGVNMPVDLTLVVSRNHVFLASGENTILDWEGDISSLELPGGWRVGDDIGLFVGSNDGASFEVSHLKVTPLTLATKATKVENRDE